MEGTYKRLGGNAGIPLDWAADQHVPDHNLAEPLAGAWPAGRDVSLHHLPTQVAALMDTAGSDEQSLSVESRAHVLTTAAVGLRTCFTRTE